MNKTALKTLIQGLEHRLELAAKKKEEEKDLFGEMSYHFVMAGLQTGIEDAKKLLDLEKEQMIELLTKYHNRLFFIPLKEGEAERIYTHLIQDNE
jgi:hypothetical protein